jgi:hypothetical protein
MIAEKIQAYVRKLPLISQTELLDFASYLLTKAEQHEEREWETFSLTSAMRGLEDEDLPQYTLADLKVVFE